MSNHGRYEDHQDDYTRRQRRYQEEEPAAPFHANRAPPPPPSQHNMQTQDLALTRMPTASVADTTATLDRLRLTSFLVRPGYGESGKPLSVLSNFFMVRPKDGVGKIIHHYDVDINPVVNHLNQKKPKGLLRAVWEQVSLEGKGDWAGAFATSVYDGRRNAFTPIPFPIPKRQAQTFITATRPDNLVQIPAKGETSSSDDENKRFKVVIKHVAVIDLETVMKFCRSDRAAPSDEEACLTGVMATNVLMRDLPSKKYTQVGATGNRFFSLNGAQPIAQGGIVCKGFMQSFRYSNCGLPLLNLDVGFSAFLASGPALEVIAKILQRGGGARGRSGPRGGQGGYMGGVPRPQEISELSDRDIHMIKNKLRGAKFSPTHRISSRLHTIMSITLQPAEKITFNIQGRDGAGDRTVSIPEYYKSYYGAIVTKPRLPCVQYGKKAFIPLEFVNLAEFNSLPPTKLSAEQTADMIKVAAMKPIDRAKAVNDWRVELGYENQPKIAAWGLQVSQLNRSQTQAECITGQYEYGTAQSESSSSAEGSVCWESTGKCSRGRTNLRGMKFYKPGPLPLQSWAIVSYDKYTDIDDMKRYITYLVDTLKAHGVQVDNARPPLVGPRDPRTPAGLIEGLQMGAREAYKASGQKPQMIFCVLPGRDAWLYEAIKKAAFTELKEPVPTQCMQAAKIRTPNGIEAYTGNLVMKVQNKLGGVTHQVPVSDLPGMEKGKTMLLGADLGHPPIKAGYDSAPTVACSIATYDADCSTFSAQIRLQQGRDEIVRDLSSMIEEHLKIFWKHNHCLPDRILVFRDGVSEGQYAACLAYEHDAILSACTHLSSLPAYFTPSYRPKILLTICAKRHNTRFFGREIDCERSGNLPSGLVVDRAVTHPYAFDFFLQAHSGRVGTARPTHYICLLDELAISPDELQRLCMGLCFGFGRCTKGVSLVPVCYIADLVCQKARIIVHEPTGNTTIAPSESSAGRTNKSGKRDRVAPGEVDVMQVQRVLEKNPDLKSVMWWM